MQGKKLEPLLALLQQLAGLRSLFVKASEPRLLFRFDYLTRLTCLALPAPTTSVMDDSFHLLQHLPKLSALAIGHRSCTYVQRDLPALSRLTQLKQLYIQSLVAVSLPPELTSLEILASDTAWNDALQLPASVTHLRIYSDCEGNPVLSLQQPSSLKHLCVELEEPDIDLSSLSALTKVHTNSFAFPEGYTKVTQLRCALCIC